MEPEGVTRATFDFQARDNFELRAWNFRDDSLELRAWEFARNISGAFQARSSINLASKHLSGAERSKLPSSKS